MSQPKDKQTYLDWFCRVHEDGCVKRGRQLSEDGREAVEKTWSAVADFLVDRPEVFRLRRAAAYAALQRAGELMAAAAELDASPAVDGTHVRKGTRALNELKDGELLVAYGICDVTTNRSLSMSIMRSVAAKSQRAT